MEDGKCTDSLALQVWCTRTGVFVFCFGGVAVAVVVVVVLTLTRRHNLAHGHRTGFSSPGVEECLRNLIQRGSTVDCMLGYGADMMAVEYCRGFQ